MDVTAEHFQAGGLSFLSRGVPVKPMKTALGIIAFMTRCSLPLWVRWHSSTKTNISPTAWLGWSSKFLDEGIEIIHILPAELVHQRAQKAWPGLPSWLIKLPAATGAVDGLARFAENALDLLVQLVAVGDDGDAGVGVVFQNPLRQQHHDDALAAALRVPDDAALAFPRILLGGLDAEILVDPRQFLDAAVEKHEVVHQFD